MPGGLQLLIVDDDELIRVVMRIALERAGHRAHVAADAREALRIATDHWPDVVVCDYRLAGTSGLTLLSEIEARAVATHAPVPAMIVVTGEERPSWPYPRLSKPFDVGDLLALAGTLLGARDAAVARR